MTAFLIGGALRLFLLAAAVTLLAMGLAMLATVG
jgi:hypothetical protein